MKFLDYYADKRELRRALRNLTDNRFQNVNFDDAIMDATSYIKTALNPNFITKYFDLSHFKDGSLLYGTASSGSGSNTLEDDSKSWTANEFTKSEIGFYVEVLVWNANNFYVADLVSNTTDTITLRNIDGENITITDGDTYYLRKKNPDLRRMAVDLGLYYWFNRNRQAVGIQTISENAQSLMDSANNILAEYIKGIRDFDYISNSESITLNGDEWQYLEREFIVNKSVTVTKNSVNYREENGWELNHIEGAIKHRTTRHSKYLNPSDTITVAYEFNIRKVGTYAAGDSLESDKIYNIRKPYGCGYWG